MKRENFKSRLGFILISAGCAIGIGNVWKFPYVTGQNGGGIFVLFYLVFLIALGVPVMTMEFAVGRASRKSVIECYQTLEKPGSKWHLHGYVAMIGNYMLMMFYTTVAGWMLSYFYRFVKNDFAGVTPEETAGKFSHMLEDPAGMTFWMVVIVIGGFLICSFGLQGGVEKISKPMMIGLLALIVILAVNSVMLEGGAEGLKFYLIPDWKKVEEVGLFNVIIAALNQSFFTLSLGIGAMEIFGSYMSRDRTLLGESLRISILDTFVAIVSGLIIFPACFAYGVDPKAGPELIFITLPNVFSAMPGGRFWGSLFFLFMTFASFSTIIAVFENIIACCMDKWKLSRKKASLINGIILLAASMPCVLGYNVWSSFQPRGEGSTVLDLEDFIVSNLLLPIGSLIFLLFCVTKWGWGFDKYLEEANSGEGIKFPRILKGYVTYVIPCIIIVILILGLK
ncbi:MAG: sodium-dependent transporter [Lachnospiraceae bacterium]|nr:sodium-dependent transporter [Lachnospiraceae bacterium]MCI8825485.1 sodium-dependent transporter [Lachnospiraceae bacterium]